MQAARLPASYGWAWLLQGWALFKRQPMTMLFWSLMTSLLINLSYLIPILGQLTLIALTPTLGFVALNACVRIERNQPTPLGLWLEPLRTPPVKQAMIRLGIAYLICCTLAGFIAVLPFTNNILPVLEQDSIDPDALMQVVKAPFMLFGILYAGISILFWHAPALMGWHHIPLKKALFYSMVACWRNKGALLIFGFCWFLIYMAMQWLASLLLHITDASLAHFLITPVNLIVMALLYSSFYPIYRSVFGQNNLPAKV